MVKTQMTIGTRLYTLFKGQQIGIDSLGNRYFVERKPGAGRRSKRWVLYKDNNDGSEVPAAWHGWLHGRTDEIPDTKSEKIYKWQIDHRLNQTGSKNAYRPPGHVLNGGKRKKATGDYKAWRPS